MGSIISQEGALPGDIAPSVEVAKSLDNPFVSVQRQGAPRCPPAYVYPALPSSTADTEGAPNPRSVPSVPSIPSFPPACVYPALPQSVPSVEENVEEDADAADLSDGSSSTPRASSAGQAHPEQPQPQASLEPTEATHMPSTPLGCTPSPPALVYPSLPGDAPPVEQVAEFMVPVPSRRPSRQPPLAPLRAPPLAPLGLPPPTPLLLPGQNSTSTTPLAAMNATPMGPVSLPSLSVHESLAGQASGESASQKAFPARSSQLQEAQGVPEPVLRGGALEQASSERSQLRSLSGLPTWTPEAEPTPHPPSLEQ